MSTLRSNSYEAHLRSPLWQQLRKQVLDAAGHCCERCREAIAYEVHHVTYERLGHERLSDLEALCPNCHQLADRERVVATSRRVWNARLNGWASKVYGDDWESLDVDRIQDEFEDWLNE